MEEKKTKKMICLPGVDEYQEMEIEELIKIKKKVENLVSFIERIIRRKIQK